MLNICHHEKPDGVIVQFGGQTPLNLAAGPRRPTACRSSAPRSSRSSARRTANFSSRCCNKLGLNQPPNGTATNEDEAVAAAAKVGYPVLVRPSFVLGGRAMQIVYSDDELRYYMRNAVAASPERPVLVDRFLDDATEVDVDCIADGEIAVIGAIMEHIEQAGVHSGDSRLRHPRAHAFRKSEDGDPRGHDQDGQGARRARPDERPVRGEGRDGLRARGQPARVAHRAVRQQGDRPCRWPSWPRRS